MDIREARLNAALAASERTRRVLLFLQTYALLLVIVYLNSRGDFGYLERRSLERAARDLYSCEAKLPFVREHVILANGGRELIARAPTGKRATPTAEAWANACAAQVGLEKTRATAVARWILDRGLSSHDLDGELDRVETDLRANVYNVPIPLTGLRIDTNVFSLVGAAGHFLMLAWLLLSVYQERANLRLIGSDPELFDIAISHMLFYPADKLRRGPIWLLMSAAIVAGVVAPLLPLTATAIDDTRALLDGVVGMFPSARVLVPLEWAFVVLGLLIGIACLWRLLAPMQRVGETQASKGQLVDTAEADDATPAVSG